MYQAVLFDLDGTLLNSIAGIIECFGKVLYEFVPGHSFTQHDMVMKIGEPVNRQMLDFSGGQAQLVEPMVARYRALMAAMLAGFPLYPGAEAALLDLRKAGYKTGLVTSKSLAPTKITLLRYSMYSWFDVIVTADDTEKHKPCPEPLYFAAQKIGIPLQASLFIGDSVHDIKCAQAAGADAGAAYWGPFPRTVLDELKPRFGFEKLADIVPVLRAMKKSI